MVSYFEQVQNNTNYYWEADEVDEKLHKKITHATVEVYEKAKEVNSYLRN
jgi:glutamate dehydrogenase/leucine dehydrogenase